MNVTYRWHDGDSAAIQEIVCDCEYVQDDKDYEIIHDQEIWTCPECKGRIEFTWVGMTCRSLPPVSQTSSKRTWYSSAENLIQAIEESVESAKDGVAYDKIVDVRAAANLIKGLSQRLGQLTIWSGLKKET